MKLTIVYDDVKNEHETLIADHGFSCYIETNEETILFDTGTNGEILLHNMKQLGKDPERISKIVLSHDHYDHTGGLSALLDHCSAVTIYHLSKTQTTETINYTQVEEPIQISKHIWSTGRLPGNPIDEQSLILKTPQGNWVLTGCSHSGVKNIIKKAEKKGEIIGLIGGFHGFNDFSILKDLMYVFPCHCTVHKQHIHNCYPTKSHQCSVGTNIDLEAISPQ